MKKGMLFLFLVLVLCGNEVVNAQIKDYFPMHVGDYWQYTYYTPGVNLPSYTSTTTIEVDTLEDLSIVTTLFSSGGFYYYYKILKDDNQTLYYCSSKFGVYYPEVKLNINKNEFWKLQTFWTRFNGKNVATILGNITDTTYYFATSYDTTFYSGSCSFYNYTRGFGETGRIAPSNTTLTGCIINGVTYGTFVDVEEELTPVDYKLKIKNYPNPFNPSTTINYSLPENDLAKITIYDMLGREVDVLINSYQNAGTHSITWAPKGVSSGIYLSVINYKNQTLTQKMIYLR
ncbi:MAG: T9SS type A sorting domain-containing protein [bacterium]